MPGDEEKALVEGEKDWVYVDRLLRNKDKVMIESMLSDEEEAIVEGENIKFIKTG